MENLSFEQKFELFREKYPKKVGKKPTYLKFKYVKDFKNLFEGLEQYLLKWKIEETPKIYIPDPKTFLNQERYYDEIIINPKKAPIYKKIIKEKEELKKVEKEELQEKEKKKYLRQKFSLLPLEERVNLRLKATEFIKENYPVLYQKKGLFYDKFLENVIIKFMN